ncbi:MAG: TrbC/VirB2 family protein [Pasteurella sp.]|nr:TrbC/VirB2 family protein [Pasteurella sp.]
MNTKNNSVTSLTLSDNNQNNNIAVMDKRWLLVMLAIVLFIVLIEPAHAQAWANKANTALQQIISGLKLLGRGVAAVVGLWGALMIMSGRKRFSDLWEWFIGAAVFLTLTEVINLFFG